jgi:VanZ family protein
VSQFFKYWLPVLIWMAIIFAFSSDSHSYEHSARIVGLFEPFLRWLFPKMSENAVGNIHEVFRKCCHLTVYAVLGILLWRAFHQSKNKLPDWSWPRVGGVLLAVFLYASSDEFHQSFVPTRTPHFTDVLIDTAGGALGLFAVWILQLRRKSKSEKNM